MFATSKPMYWQPKNALNGACTQLVYQRRIIHIMVLLAL